MLHKCSQCNYITDIKCNLKRHQSRIHKNDNISSANIATNGVNISKKDVNISKKNDIPIDSFQCHKCSKVYGSENALSIHINTCKTILCKGPLECHKCNKIFTSIENKLYHLNNCKQVVITENNTLVPYQCGICTKSFKNKRNLEYHLNICKGVNNSLECHICHRIFNSHSAKSFHLKSCKPIIKDTNDINQEFQYKKTQLPQSIRISVWDTYIGRKIGETKCYVCNNNNISQFDFHCGHVIAEKNGGKSDISNLRPICKSCNCSMRTCNLEEYKQKYFINE